MPRQKYQRPEVYAWVGKSGEKFWKAEWRVYIEGRPKPKHRAQTWPQSRYTKTKAQEACDKLVREETDGYQRPDGNLTVGEYWEKVYWPSRKRRVAPNTVSAYESYWAAHVKPAIGGQELQRITRGAVSAVLDKMADSGLGESALEMSLTIMRGMFRDAQEEGYITRNPTYNVEPPRCQPTKETRALTVDEVRRLFANTTGRDRLLWRVLLLTGARISEACALKREDLIPAGLRIDESAYHGRADQTKTRKIRYAPIPADLRREIGQWDSGHPELIFPTLTGKMQTRDGHSMRAILSRGRALAKIPDLKFRMTRTTFATLFDGDLRDAQEIMGHSDLRMTVGTYRKAQAARMQASVDEMNARFTGKVVELPQQHKQA